MTPGPIRARSAAARHPGAGPLCAGPLHAWPPRWLVILLVAAGLVALPGFASANPWGLPENPGQGTGVAGPGEQPSGVAPDDRFRSDAGAPPALAPADAGSPGYADAPAPGTAGYRFRGDSPRPGGGVEGWSDPGSYRFRPLTERELKRQGAGTRPAAPDRAQGHPSGTAPAWPPRAPAGFEAGPWPSR